MPPEGYTTVTITEETAAKLAELIAHTDDLRSMGDAVEHAVDLALADQETITNANLARLLHERLSTE
jgi:hypothetical protein